MGGTAILRQCDWSDHQPGGRHAHSHDGSKSESPAGHCGTLTKSGGTVVSTIGVPITASGPLSAASGTLDFISGGTLNTGTSFSASGSGTPLLSAGTFTIPASNAANVSLLTFSGGTLTGPGLLDVLTNGTLTWTGGTMSGVGGTTRVESGGTLVMGGTADRILTDRTLDNRGLVNWSNSGALLMGGTAILTMRLERPSTWPPTCA